MRYFRGCPKCGGSVFPERQLGGEVDYTCLQCGRRLTPEQVATLLKKVRVPAPRIAA